MNRKTTESLAMRQHLAHDNDRMREALRTIVAMAETSPSALTMNDIARIARAALIAIPRENPALRHPETKEASCSTNACGPAAAG
ncbi:hypothetical protein PPMP20_26640 [Paraburkholderia phymatum]|uniref:Uncharacterized protein n=1 Tax=Paraburkholderia phymatum (strain DSM 17167 / CIP 108236 / LMG 21445 / STM815) TaxID=391038 RepID=B2JL33_PARP8|nr:hypothetical protein [Paraburkholderia phymatum]ACC72562.1 hypothetical protein Bphy_3408 [Paraburkholderia phymatum STM815]